MRAGLRGIVAVMPVAWIAAAMPASAAVRSCVAPFAGEVARAATEPAAKSQALASWAAKAQRAGAGFSSWRLADKKVLGCTKAKAPGTGFECIAYAAPCTISQNPDKPKRLRPFGRNVPFEV